MLTAIMPIFLPCLPCLFVEKLGEGGVILATDSDADVIDMRMSEEHCLYAGKVNCWGGPIAHVPVTATLEQAAVDQQPYAIGLN